MKKKVIRNLITVVCVTASFSAAAYIISFPFTDRNASEPAQQRSQTGLPAAEKMEQTSSAGEILKKGSKDVGVVPTMLRAKGNCITNDFSDNILLKGLMPLDFLVLYDTGRLKKATFDDMKNAGANVVRIPIHPDHWVRVDDYLEKLVVPAVTWANELGMYAIIDLHFIGNIVTGEGINLEGVDNPKELAEDFWIKAASRFKDSQNVLFEICNEPAQIEEKQWRDYADSMVDLIRSQGAAQMIIVGGVRYSQLLSWVKEYPISDNNIAYAAHIYPAHDSSEWENWFGEVSMNKPVIVTEWGYIDENREETEQAYLVGDKNSYGVPFLNYLEEKNIGWVACWYDDTWEPEIFKKGGAGYTNYGQFVMDKLKEAEE